MVTLLKAAFRPNKLDAGLLQHGLPVRDRLQCYGIARKDVGHYCCRPV